MRSNFGFTSKKTMQTGVVEEDVKSKLNKKDNVARRRRGRRVGVKTTWRERRCSVLEALLRFSGVTLIQRLKYRRATTTH